MFLKGTTVPAISFRYGGKDISISDSYEDKATGLRVTVETKRFKDHPHAIDWVAYFENHGNADTPVIENILPLDLTAPMADKEKLTLHHAKGSSCHIDDFIPRATELGLNAWPRTNRITLAPLYGRSSNGTLPFMNLQHAGGGMAIAIGWSGQWSATFERTAEGVHVTAGMERTHLSLRPGEKIRTPRILLVQWEGDDAEIGNNALRRVMIDHYLPRIDGKLVMPPAAQCIQGYYYLTGKAGEELEYRAGDSRQGRHHRLLARCVLVRQHGGRQGGLVRAGGLVGGQS